MKDKPKGVLSGFVMDMLREGRFDVPPDRLRAPKRGHEFPEGLPRTLGLFLDLLGWDAAAEYFTSTPSTIPENFQQPLVQVPRADPQSGVQQVRIRFQADTNQTLMLKNVSVGAANRTAERFGEVVFAQGVRTNKVVEQRQEGRIGTERQRGRWVKPQSVVIANGAIFEIIMRNFDALSEARFCVNLRTWVIQR